jgi:hypothetical protein
MASDAVGHRKHAIGHNVKKLVRDGDAVQRNLPWGLFRSALYKLRSTFFKSLLEHNRLELARSLAPALLRSPAPIQHISVSSSIATCCESGAGLFICPID